MPKAKTRSSFGSIQYVSTDKYRVFWEDAPGSDGKRRRRSKVVRGTRRDAEDYLAAMRLSPARDTTYRQLHVMMAEEEALLAENTRVEYARAWRHIDRHVGGKPVASTTPAEAERVIRAAGAPSAQRKVLRYWRKMCNRAIHEGVIARNPIDRYIRTDRVRRRSKRLLRADELQAWMEAIRGIKYEPILLAEIGGGLSPEEACALEWEDIAPMERRGKTYALLTVSRALTSVQGRKVLKDTKNEYRTRQMVVGWPFSARLLELKSVGPVCPSGMPHSDARPERKYTSPVTITHNWKSWCEGHEVAYVTQANMRSSFSTLHGEAGTPDSVVSGAMGHSDGTTKRKWYQQVTVEALCAAADQLERYLREMFQSVPSHAVRESPTRRFAEKEENRT